MKNTKQEKRAGKRLARVRKVLQGLAARAAGYNFAGWVAGRNGAILNNPDLPDEIRQRMRLMHGMTNWQRNQCLRECKGALRDMSTERMQYWAAKPHWKREA